MIALKSCPRCRGDLYLGLDSVFSCLQCGYELNPQAGEQLQARLQEARRLRLALAA